MGHGQRGGKRGNPGREPSNNGRGDQTKASQAALNALDSNNAGVKVRLDDEVQHDDQMLEDLISRHKLTSVSLTPVSKVKDGRAILHFYGGGHFCARGLSSIHIPEQHSANWEAVLSFSQNLTVYLYSPTNDSTWINVFAQKRGMFINAMGPQKDRDGLAAACSYNPTLKPEWGDSAAFPIEIGGVQRDAIGYTINVETTLSSTLPEKDFAWFQSDVSGEIAQISQQKRPRILHPSWQRIFLAGSEQRLSVNKIYALTPYGIMDPSTGRTHSRMFPLEGMFDSKLSSEDASGRFLQFAVENLVNILSIKDHNLTTVWMLADTYMQTHWYANDNQMIHLDILELMEALISFLCGDDEPVRRDLAVRKEHLVNIINSLGDGDWLEQVYGKKSHVTWGQAAQTILQQLKAESDRRETNNPQKVERAPPKMKKCQEDEYVPKQRQKPKDSPVVKSNDQDSTTPTQSKGDRVQITVFEDPKKPKLQTTPLPQPTEAKVPVPTEPKVEVSSKIRPVSNQDTKAPKLANSVVVKGVATAVTPSLPTVDQNPPAIKKSSLADHFINRLNTKGVTALQSAVKPSILSSAPTRAGTQELRLGKQVDMKYYAKEKVAGNAQTLRCLMEQWGFDYTRPEQFKAPTKGVTAKAFMLSMTLNTTGTTVSYPSQTRVEIEGYAFAMFGKVLSIAIDGDENYTLEWKGLTIDLIGLEDN